jgi:Terminase large subunit, T4likevirus-type, N-terminal
VSTAQLRREISYLRERRPSRRPAIPEDRLEFAAAAGLPNLDPWQEKLLRSDSSRILLNCSRQSGKSTMAAIIALHQALRWPSSLVLILAPAERQAKELFTKVAQAYRVLGHAVPAESYRKMGAELANGSRIEALPGTEKTIRGFSGVDLLLVDEASRVADELYYAVRPMLAVSGGRLMMLSTPYVRRGVFFEEWTGDGAWERYEVPASQCPRISEVFLEEERQALPTRIYRQEYECSFEDTEDAVFAYEDVQAAISSEVTPLFGEAS